MKTQQKKTTATSALESSNQFQSRGFILPTNVDQQNDLKAQLERSETYGHNIAKIPNTVETGKYQPIQAQFTWTKSQLEAQAGKKHFRSQQYKNIVRIVTEYNKLLNSTPQQRINCLKQLIEACQVWSNRNISETSANVEQRRNVIQKLQNDASKEINHLQAESTDNQSITPSSSEFTELDSRELIALSGEEAEEPESEPTNSNSEIPKNYTNEQVELSQPASSNSAGYGVKIPASGIDTLESSATKPQSQKSDHERLTDMGLKWDNPYWILDDFIQLSNAEITDLLSGAITIDNLRNPGNSGLDSESDSDSDTDSDDEISQKASKAPQDKALRYKARALALERVGNFVGAGVQYTRAYQEDSLIDYAAAAAQLFNQAKDFERAALWSRKTIECDSTSPFANQAREILSSRKLPEKAPYKTEEMPYSTEIEHTGVKKRQVVSEYSNFSDEQKREIKNSGLYREEKYSDTAANLIKVNVEQYKSGKIAEDVLLSRVKNMATGFDAKALIDEYSAYRDDNSKPTPMLDQLKQKKVSYLNTTEARNPLRLFYENKIQQGEATQTGYDTSQLSTNFAGGGYGIFVMSGDGDIYAAQHRVSQFHHSSLLAGADAAASGEIKVESGSLKAITNKSGHYRQGAFYLAQSLKEFKERLQQNLSNVSVSFHTSKSKVVWDGGAANFVEDESKYCDTFKTMETSPSPTAGEDIKEAIAKQKASAAKSSNPQQGSGGESKAEEGGYDHSGNESQAEESDNYQTGGNESQAEEGASQQGNAPQIILPPRFIQGSQGMAISPTMLNAIRQDILSTGIASKWADEHEIKALATALGIQIKIINAPGGDRTYGNSGNLYELLYNGRDHYNARVPIAQSIGGMSPQYEDRKIPGDGDCFYNSVAAIKEAYARIKPSAQSLRQQVNQQLTNQDIADIAVPLVRDFKKGQMTGIGQNFIASMRQRNPGQGDLYITQG